MKTDRRLWIALVLVLIGTFSILGFYGREIYRQAPPIPDRVVTEWGRVLMTRDDILTGQQVWQSIGGQQVGSIWGHGAYQAPDWSADWLHREATKLLQIWSARDHFIALSELSAQDRAALEARLRSEMRSNTYDTETGSVVVSEDRAAAMADTGLHYSSLFGGDPALRDLRDDYAMLETSVVDSEKLRQLNAFFFWTSWACTTERPGLETTYTNNWPHEPLVGNRPSSANILWSLLSIAALLAGAGGLVAYHAARRHDESSEERAPLEDPLEGLELTPSMRATAKYCGLVILLFVVQVLLGALTAHYTVEGREFFGLPLGEILPYSVTRTWHLQTALFWIATAFLTAGLFLAPAIGGREPRHQRLGVNVLFGALLVVVGGSMAGEWLAVQQWLDLDLSFWFGHQGYEYVELGRVWQIGLFVGLMLWLVLMLRALWPALVRQTEHRQITLLFAGSAAAIGLFYGAGFFYGARTHLTVMEYWRWWVVHLWVEGFMEVFATAAIAILFSRLGLIGARSAARAVLFSTSIFLVGGIPGTFHHLYFSGTPITIMAIGACFSALEVVPLVMVGFEALETLRSQERASWMERYRWPIRFFVGVSFWNLIGAGVFGFLINPPIALYYMQGLNTTPVHAHTALFGVYGLLALGLVLVVLRRLMPVGEWREGPLAFAFWSMNIGLGLMVCLSLLPIGLIQTYASIETGLWFARSAEFMQQPFIQNLRWMRMLGDTVFLAGVGSLAWFVLGLRTGWSYQPGSRQVQTKPENRAGISAEPIWVYSGVQPARVQPSK
ncbi:MAG: nitric-oxide reductase large subunit [bacterium]|nr:nitric-oxide reductase large subunit [bacterium]